MNEFLSSTNSVFENFSLNQYQYMQDRISKLKLGVISGCIFLIWELRMLRWCWSWILETKYIGGIFEMYVTNLVDFVTNIHVTWTMWAQGLSHVPEKITKIAIIKNVSKAYYSWQFSWWYKEVYRYYRQSCQRVRIKTDQKWKIKESS